MHFYETTEALPLLGSVPQALVDEEDKIISSTVENTQPALVDDESPYDIVAANVSNRDDPTLPCLTFRSCTLGLLFTCILAFVNQFFSFRTTPILLGMIIPQLLSYPMGKVKPSSANFVHRYPMSPMTFMVYSSILRCLRHRTHRLRSWRTHALVYAFSRCDHCVHFSST
ncbi:unnamed protein product [Rotaria sordida]|uniref:Uncharacterized protein n=1 Tax=Rotaria sordida TaxID=392033 RepID=A0A814D4C4_9BILA|nr:unnamed protein product [Rotaria sordida]